MTGIAIKTGARDAPGRLRRRWILVSTLAALLVLGYLIWPRIMLWRLDRALIQGDRSTLAALVDLDSIRAEIRDRLNKESESTIGPFSDAFIAWLEHAIRRDGTRALEEQIDLDWVRDRLLSHSDGDAGISGSLTECGFDNPLRFGLQIGAPGAQPVFARLSYHGTGWRLTALYF